MEEITKLNLILYIEKKTPEHYLLAIVTKGNFKIIDKAVEIIFDY